MRGYNIVLTLLLVVMLIGIGSTSNYLPQQINTPFNLTVSSNNATDCNLSYIQYPNGNMIIYNQQLIKDGNTFYTTIDSANYSTLGSICHGVTCTDGINNQPGSICREITINGKESSIQEGIIYGILLFILIGFLCLALYGAFKIPSENQRSPEGDILRIEWKKYTKMFCWGISYMLFVAVIYICWNLSFAFVSLGTLTNIFGVAFRITYSLSFAGMIVFPIIIVIRWIKDKRLEDMLRRGLTVK